MRKERVGKAMKEAGVPFSFLPFPQCILSEGLQGQMEGRHLTQFLQCRELSHVEYLVYLPRSAA